MSIGQCTISSRSFRSKTIFKKWLNQSLIKPTSHQPALWVATLNEKSRRWGPQWVFPFIQMRVCNFSRSLIKIELADSTDDTKARSNSRATPNNFFVVLSRTVNCKISVSCVSLCWFRLVTIDMNVSSNSARALWGVEPALQLLEFWKSQKNHSIDGMLCLLSHPKFHQLNLCGSKKNTDQLNKEIKKREMIS